MNRLQKFFFSSRDSDRANTAIRLFRSGRPALLSDVSTPLSLQVVFFEAKLKADPAGRCCDRSDERRELLSTFQLAGYGVELLSIKTALLACALEHEPRLHLDLANLACPFLSVASQGLLLRLKAMLPQSKHQLIGSLTTVEIPQPRVGRAQLVQILLWLFQDSD